MKAQREHSTLSTQHMLNGSGSLPSGPTATSMSSQSFSHSNSTSAMRSDGPGRGGGSHSDSATAGKVSPRAMAPPTTASQAQQSSATHRPTPGGSDDARSPAPTPKVRPVWAYPRVVVWWCGGVAREDRAVGNYVCSFHCFHDR